MNICKNCEHCIIPHGAQHWSQSLCGAPEQELDPAVNPITGEECWRGVMDEGEYLTKIRHPLCVNINPSGACTSFVEAQPLWFRKLQIGAHRN